MDFEWDPVKAKRNLTKHGISFEEAVLVFSDKKAIDLPDEYFFETRFIRIGLNSNLGILVVIFCERHEETVRIISARKATHTEEKLYEERIRF